MIKVIDISTMHSRISMADRTMWHISRNVVPAAIKMLIRREVESLAGMVCYIAKCVA